MPYLYDALLAYADSDAYPLHMPGHKRQLGGMCDPFKIDITEIDGFDNLHHAEGILKEAMERAAKLYGSQETHFLVNGSTCGILTAISAACKGGERQGRGGLLMARNSHKAAFHAAYLMDREPVWLFPEEDAQLPISGRITPEQVEEALRAHPEIGTVFIVSPTYDGVISDVEGIVRVTRKYGAILIVDEAHGAHYGLAGMLPRSSVQCGADLVIHSMHKTLPSLTQTALLHVNGSLVDRRLVSRFLAIYQTSSPSYVLMASMDACIRLMEQQAEPLFAEFYGYLDAFYARVKSLRHLRAACADDPTRILILPGDAGLSGGDICAILRKEHALELEMATPLYALALMSVGDTEEGLRRLADALERLDAQLPDKTEPADTVQEDGRGWQGDEQRICTMCQALDAAQRSVLLEETEGLCAGEYVFLYPPGIPILVPGERVTRKKLNQLLWCRRHGYTLQGMEDQKMQYLQVAER